MAKFRKIASVDVLKKEKENGLMEILKAIGNVIAFIFGAIIWLAIIGGILSLFQ